MDRHFHPERGERAFPDGCPCCGEVVTRYEPEDDEQVALWRFGCGCEVIDDGRLTVEEDCPEAMDMWMDGIIVHRSEEA